MQFITVLFVCFFTIVSCQNPCSNGGDCIFLSECPSLYALQNQRPQRRQIMKYLLNRQCGSVGTLPKVCCVDFMNITTTLQKKPSTITTNHCKTPRNLDGNCVSVKACKSLYTLLMSNPNTQEREFLAQSQCGKEGDMPLVCCEKIILPEINTGNGISPISPYLPSYDDCGVQNGGNRIIGGIKALLHDFPWMTLLQYEAKNGDKYFLCGGTLISKRYVLTAAHCVTGENVQESKLISVRVGEYDLRTEEDCLENYGCNKKPQDISVDEIIPHEEYADDMNRHYDIALIRLSQDVQFHESVQPICLPNKGREIPNSNDKYTVSGWGVTESNDNNLSNMKLKLIIPKYDTTSCQNKYGSKIAGFQLSNTIQFCAGGENGKDSCKGDSGGPIMVPYKQYVGTKEITKWFQQGIVSFGVKPCGRKGYPAIYTKLNAFINWIVNKLKA